jgi:hypothetical protein
MDKDVIEMFSKQVLTNDKPDQIDAVVPFLKQCGFEVSTLLEAGTYGIVTLAKNLVFG